MMVARKDNVTCIETSVTKFRHSTLKLLALRATPWTRPSNQSGSPYDDFDGIVGEESS